MILLKLTEESCEIGFHKALLHHKMSENRKFPPIHGGRFPYRNSTLFSKGLWEV